MFLQHTYIWKIFLLCLHIFFYDVTYAIRAIFQISFVDIVCNGIVLALLAIVTYDARDRLSANTQLGCVVGVGCLLLLFLNCELKVKLYEY